MLTPYETAEIVVRSFSEALRENPFISVREDGIVKATMSYFYLLSSAGSLELEELDFSNHFGFTPNTNVLIVNAVQEDMRHMIVNLLQHTDWDLVFDVSGHIWLSRFKNMLVLDTEIPYRSLFDEANLNYSVRKLATF